MNIKVIAFTVSKKFLSYLCIIYSDKTITDIKKIFRFYYIRENIFDRINFVSDITINITLKQSEKLN